MTILAQWAFYRLRHHRLSGIATSALMLVGFGGEQHLAAKTPKEFLDFKAIRYSQASKEPAVLAITFDKDSLVTLHDKRDYYFHTPFNKNAEEKTMAFTTKPYGIAKSQKFSTGKIIGKGRWVGRVHFQDRGIFLIDGRFDLGVFDAKNTPISKRSIILDLLRPAPDSRGEPTNLETSRFRAKLMRNYRTFKPKEIIITGVVPLPKTWHDKDRSQYLVATKISDFTVMTMKCDQKDLGYCAIKRGCFISSRLRIDPRDVTGIAISEARRLLLLGDRKSNRILSYSFRSCFQIKQVGVTYLPDELEEISNLLVDQNDRLWVSTKKKDSRLNSSVFAWESRDW